MIWVAALFIVLAFLALARLLSIPARTAEVVQRARRALSDLRDATLDERGKEQAIQAHAARMFVLFLRVAGSTAIALGAPLGIVALLGAAGWLDLHAVLDAMLSWQILVAATVIGFAVFLFSRSRRQ